MKWVSNMNYLLIFIFAEWIFLMGLVVISIVDTYRSTKQLLPVDNSGSVYSIFENIIYGDDNEKIS